MATQEIYDLTTDRERSSTVALDRELTLSFQRGDPFAYDSIYRRFSPRVHQVCQRMLADPQEAQDAAQETFLRVYQALPRFNGRYQLGAWINRIATNVCLDLLRSRSRSRSEAAPNEVLEDAVAPEQNEDPETAMLRRAEGTQVHETLATLSPLHRAAILMRDIEGRDYREIATALGVSECRARVLLHRARKGFKKSWSSTWVLGGLWDRVVQRLRRSRTPLADEVAGATSSAAHVSQVATSGGHVSLCGQMLGHCGEIVSERLAAAATAALVGVSVAGGVPAIRHSVVEASARASETVAVGREAVNEALSAEAPSAAPERRTRAEAEHAGSSSEEQASTVGDDASAGTDDAVSTAPVVTVDPAAEDTAGPVSEGTADPVSEDTADPVSDGEAPADSTTEAASEASPSPPPEEQGTASNGTDDVPPSDGLSSSDDDASTDAGEATESEPEEVEDAAEDTTEEVPDPAETPVVDDGDDGD